MTKAMFILSSTSSSLELWSVNHTSIHENSELEVFKNKIFFCEISSNWTKDLLEQMYVRLLNLTGNYC